MNTAPQADSQASAFASLTALRDAHTELLLSSKKGHQDAVQQGLIRNFLARAKATGSRLDAPIEREAAQNILMYWDSQLYSASDKATLDAALPRLDPFDPINSPDLSNVKSPFRGLSAFGEGDAARFLGREQAVKTLLEKLAEQPTVLVVGPAGSGKTSLVFAGVVPALKLRLAQDDKNPVVLSSSPGVHPLASLLNSILDAAGPHAPPDAAAWFAAQRQKLSRSPDMFGALLESIFPGRPAILIVDPLGDIFALCRDQEEREAFGKALISATRSAGDSNRLILIVDDRYREAALQFAAFKSLEQNKAAVYSLPPLAPADVIRAVTAAADTVGLKFDDGILEDLAKDIVGDASALPALQFTLGRLWDKRQGNRVTWDAYHGDHGVGRPREALRRTAESVFANLSDDREREAARELFLQLVRPQAEGRSGGDFTRRRVRRDVLEQLPESGRTMKAIDAYEKAGLVRMMPGSHPEDDSFEVAHEALVDAWPRLREWLQEDREASRKLLQLVAIARRWQEGGADPRSGYLLSGKALEDAESHVSEAPEIGEFVFASKRELQRKERWAKWLRNGVIAVLTILLVFAAWQWRRAEYEAESALRSAENAFKAVNLMLDVVSADRLKGTINVKAAEELLKSAEVIVNAVEDRQELLKTRIDLLSKISDIDVLLNKQEEALDRLQMADRLSQRFVKDKTSDEDWAAYGYQIDYKIGDIKAGQNKPDEALPRYESALDMGRRLAQLHPDDIVKQCNVPFIMNKIGDIYFSGKDWLRALDKYNESRAIGERLMKEHSTDPNASKAVGDAMARIANTLLEMKKYNDAFEEYNAVIKIQEGLVQSAPENDVYLSNLSRSHGNLGTAYLKNGRVPEALNEYRKAQRDQEKLALKDDSNADWKVALARDYMSIGDACRTTDETKKPFDLACAETNYRRAVEIRDALADKMQGCADCQAAAANSHQYLGIALTLEQKFEAAAAEFKTEAEYRGRRAKSDPLNAEYQAALADAFDRLGDALTKAGKNEEALGAYQSGLSGIETFLSAKPDDKLSAHHDAFQGKIKELAQPGQ